MVRDNWLLAYARTDGIQAALDGMAGRTSFYSGMEYATESLLADYDNYLSEFRIFFPEVVAYAESTSINLLSKTGDPISEIPGSSLA